MKKITQAATTGGAPIYLDDFKDVFNLELWDVMQAMLSDFDSDTEGIIVSGCEISGTAGNYTLSAGIVYLDGEFRRFAQQTGLSLPQYIKAATDVNTTRTFEDTIVKTLYVTKSADLDTSAPGSGQYIAITTTTDPDVRRRFKTKIIEIGDWNMDSTSGKLVTHGITDYTRIRDVSVMIRNDANNIVIPLNRIDDPATGLMSGSVTAIQSSTISLVRYTGGNFDSTDYDSTGYNRGWVTITYQ